MKLLMILAIPMVVCLANYFIFHNKVHWKELLMQTLSIVILISAVAFGFSGSKKKDSEIINGHVTSKERVRISCQHGYPCNPHDCMCDEKGNCMTCWDTCYTHSYDIAWNVHATLGMYQSSFRVNTIDSQGLQEPPRWTQFKKGDFHMKNHDYDNYVKANADTIYKTRGYADRFAKFIPPYPSSPSDYYTVLDRVMQVGTKLPDIREWNYSLTKLNSELGPLKQCNVLMIMTSGQPSEYYQAIEEAWLGGKKNDIVVMIDSDPDGKINWTNTLSWAKNDIFRVKMRDDIMTIGKLDRDSIFLAMQDNIGKLFVRKRMREFKYLDSAIILTDKEFKWLLIAALLLSIAISAFVSLNSFDADSENRNRRFRI